MIVTLPFFPARDNFRKHPSLYSCVPRLDTGFFLYYIRQKIDSGNKKPNKKPTQKKGIISLFHAKRRPRNEVHGTPYASKNFVGFLAYWSSVFSYFSKTQQKTRQSRKKRIATLFTVWQAIHEKIYYKFGNLREFHKNDTHASWNNSQYKTFLTFVSITPIADFRIYFESLAYQIPEILGFRGFLFEERIPPAMQVRSKKLYFCLEKKNLQW